MNYCIAPEYAQNQADARATMMSQGGSTMVSIHAVRVSHGSVASQTVCGRDYARAHLQAGQDWNNPRATAMRCSECDELTVRSV